MLEFSYPNRLKLEMTYYHIYESILYKKRHICVGLHCAKHIIMVAREQRLTYHMFTVLSFLYMYT